MLKQRVITAAILIPIVIAILFFASSEFFIYATGFMILGAAWEWSNLMETKNIIFRLLYVVVVFVSLIIALYIPAPLIFFCAIIWWLIAIPFIALYPRLSNCWKNQFVRAGMGLVVLIPCWGAINFIRNQNDGMYALLFLFILIWGADTTAYFVGKKWGKTKLIAKVSPGKSVEGMVGALIFTVIAALLVLEISHSPFEVWPFGIALSVLTVLFSIEGDLLESMLKRKVGIKDSGNLLPGHGGLLDRIDSLTAAAPVFAFGTWVLGMYF